MDTGWSSGAYALAGVVLGATLQWGANWALARRGERGERRAAARVVLSELRERHGWIQFALGENIWAGILVDEIRVSSWAEHRAVLARVLSSKAWDAVNDAVSDAARIHAAAQGHASLDRIYPSSQEGAPEEADRVELTSAAESYERAIVQLSRVADWRAPIESIE
ncbi:MAG TPA: hypothetical protein VGI76_11550 [Solirubrobacteraceae bacterium]